MRVVHICQRDDPAIGGSLRVAEALVREQLASGLEVWLLFLYGPPAKVSAQFPDERIICLGQVSSKEVARGIPALRKAMGRIKPDIIHSHDGINWPRLALFGMRVPIVTHSHLPVWEPTTLKQKVERALAVKCTDFLIGISHHTIESWKAAGFPAAKVRYVPNGVELSRYHLVDGAEKSELRRSLDLPESKKILLWVGQLHRGTKGTDRLEHVAERLPEDTILLVVGGGPEYEGIQARCSSLIESKKMIMKGTVSDPSPYYMASDVFLFASHEEAFGLVLLEAVACGLPILSFPVTRGGGAVELLEEFHSVQLENDADADAVEEALNELHSRTDLVQRLQESIKEKYAWDTISGEVVQIYKMMKNKQSVKVLVCQHGSRHRYSIPRVLESAGALVAFYTDASSASFVGKCIRFFRSMGMPPVRGARWGELGISKEKIFSSDCNLWVELFQTLTKSRKSGIELYRQRHHYLSQKMIRKGLQGANVVYSMYYENLEFIRWAKKQGAKCVVDVYVSPLTDDIMIEEAHLFSDWEGRPDQEVCRVKREMWAEVAALADVLVCPSGWVEDGVHEVSPEARGKTRVVPYGCSIQYKTQNVPVKGRILFAGREALRKGVHYLGEAASMLKDAVPDLDVRIAGSMPEEVVNHPVCKDLNFLGQLTTDQMKEEFLSADAFALPALSEGFASVVAESIGAGCPVIVTREAGSPIVHEREGIIIPSRDVDALAGAMQRMIVEREFRDQCSRHCLEQSIFYTEEQWEKRLMDVLNECVDA